MTKNEIIEKWYRERVVQDIVKKFKGSSTNSKWDDLEQMIWLELLEKDDKLIEHLETTNTYRYFIARMIKTNVTSIEGRFYYKILRYSKTTTDITPWTNTIPIDNDTNETLGLLRSFVATLEGDEAILAEEIMNMTEKSRVPVKAFKERTGKDYGWAVRRLDRWKKDFEKYLENPLCIK